MWCSCLIDRRLISGRSALVLSHAGKSTLASRLAAQPLEELSERFGRDLLEALRHLEEQGISHRDIKPENIGVAMRGARDERDLFSTTSRSPRLKRNASRLAPPATLTRSCVSRVGAGLTCTPTATLRLSRSRDADGAPVYGDGTADTFTIEDGPRIRESDFDSSVAGDWSTSLSDRLRAIRLIDLVPPTRCSAWLRP